MTGRSSTSALGLACALALTLGMPRRAAAHQGPQSYCTVTSVPGGIDVEVETPLVHLARPLGIEQTPSDADVEASSAALAEKIESRVQARTELGACSVRRETPRIVDRDMRSLIVRLSFYCPAGSVVVQNAWPLELEPGAPSLCAVDGSAWAPTQDSLEYQVGRPKTVRDTLREFLELGARHVLGGIDHLLFVLALLIRAAWDLRDAPLRRKFGTVTLLVTSFTAGHSLTLVPAGLGFVSLSSRVVESVIALSIVFMGVANVVQENARGRPLVAASFGLIHGLGFAGALSDTELPRRATLQALLAFNVGIELAQLGVVLLAFPALAYAARHPRYRARFSVPSSWLIALVGAVWFVKRATGVEFLAWLGA